MEFYASCPEGFETALAEELRALGTPRVRRLKGRVAFEGTAADAERVCLWSRLASRVFALLGRFVCRDANDLYNETYALPWGRMLRRGSTIAVSARGVNDNLRNTHYSALQVKDAVCDRLADEAGARADVDTDDPDARILLSLRGERASLHLDLSGEPLFRRLPREATRPGAADVLRPDYAALALAQAGWDAACRTGEGRPVLIDVRCGGGGVLLEAAAVALDRAPGIARKKWGFTCWNEHDTCAWEQLVAEAHERADAAAAAPLSARIVATDTDGRALSLARRVLKAAGLDRNVIFAQPSADKIAPKLGLHPGRNGGAGIGAGAIVVDMLTTALSDVNPLLALVDDLRETPGLEDLPVVALTRDKLIDRALGGRAAFEARIMPHNEEARLATFLAHDGAGGAVRDEARGDASASSASRTRATVDAGDGQQVPVLVPESDQFAARLRKVARTRRKWAKRAGVTCYRVYDADLPDYSAAIDLYEGGTATPGRWLVIAEYAAPKSVDAALAQARFLDILAIAPRVLGVESDHVAARSRTRSRGGSQYADAGSKRGGGRSEKQPDVFIQEGGLTFSVNFNDYLDTGIFLDHRVTRGMVRDLAAGCGQFLNLFAYTGTATCYAAAGGAKGTTTVDMSNTYLDWARRNMEQNGFTGRAHRFVRADVLAWIAQQRRTNHRWDLIFCDPPTFSNSSKMGERTWDVQRDHVELLDNLVHLLTPGGQAVFSCNLRTFKPDWEALEQLGVELEDISEQTIPEDFARNKRIHRCYIVRRR